MSILGNNGYREPNPLEEPIFEEVDVEIDLPEEVETYLSESGSLITRFADGSAEIDFDPERREDKVYGGFYSNLAEDMDEYDLNCICEDLLTGIESDIQSRGDMEAQYQKALDLIGMKIEQAGTDTTSGTVSKVHHPLLLEAVVRYQANARGELLPASGPVKVRDDAVETGIERSEMAEALEKDMNHYLTSVAKEYYPDFDRMLFSMGLVGCAFRKIYHCPMRRRPVVEFVPAKDLIVSVDATDLQSAGRVTHRITMRQAVMKRMQLVGLYRQCDLTQPTEDITESDRKEMNLSGINPSPSTLPNDYEHQLFEVYAELDLPGHEHKEGLLLPYKVTIEKTSRKILEIRRHWREDDDMFMPRRRFVKYGLIPGLGFYDYGYIHLLGNTTRALTAIERQLLDAGQFNNFPGLLIAKQNSRQATTQIRVMPGGAHEIETNGQPISNMVMSLPYKEPSAVLAQLATAIAGDARNLAGSAELPVGEGRADIPVGTIIAMIEQSTKVMGAIHKRNHTSQQEEFEILRELFMEDPESLWKFSDRYRHKWMNMEELSDKRLVPASDPNVPSHIHRIMQVTALVQRSDSKPELYNVRAVERLCLKTLGFNPDDILAPEQPPGQQQQLPPEVQKVMLEAKSREAEQNKEMEQDERRHLMKMEEKRLDMEADAIDNASDEKIATMRLMEKRQDRSGILPVDSGI